MHLATGVEQGRVGWDDAGALIGRDAEVEHNVASQVSLPLCLAPPPSPSLPLCLPHCVFHRSPHRLSPCAQVSAKLEAVAGGVTVLATLRALVEAMWGGDTRHRAASEQVLAQLQKEQEEVEAAVAKNNMDAEVGHTAMRKWRIVTLGFGAGRQKTALERWTNPKLSRRTCSPRYGLQSCRGRSAGVSKRPRERFPTRNPNHYDSQLFHRLRCHCGGISPAVSDSSVPLLRHAQGGCSEGSLMSHDAGSDDEISDNDSADECYAEDDALGGDSEQLTRLYQNKRKWEEVESARVTARQDTGATQRQCEKQRLIGSL
jgi:hypothetical protein